MKSSSINLLPCPFCGEDDDLHAYTDEVLCGYCGCRVGSMGKTIAINTEIWNTRDDRATQKVITNLDTIAYILQNAEVEGGFDTSDVTALWEVSLEELISVECFKGVRKYFCSELDYLDYLSSNRTPPNLTIRSE